MARQALPDPKPGSAPDTHAPSSTDYRILADFRKYLRRFLAFSEEITNAAGVPPSQYQAMLALRVLSEDGVVTPSLLAKQLSLKLNSTVELVNRLEVAGHVERARSSADRRVITIALTPLGREKLAVLGTRHLEHHRAHIESLIASMGGLIR